MPAYPAIHQVVTGAGVETRRPAVGVQQRHIRDPADVDDGAIFACGSEHPAMESGRERRALTAEREVRAPEIGNDSQAGHLCDDLAGRRSAA